MTIQRPSAVDDNLIPACSTDPSSWDLDASTKDRLKIAVRTCRFECPVYQACRDALAARRDGGGTSPSAPANRSTVRRSCRNGRSSSR